MSVIITSVFFKPNTAEKGVFFSYFRREAAIFFSALFQLFSPRSGDFFAHFQSFSALFQLFSTFFSFFSFFSHFSAIFAAKRRFFSSYFSAISAILLPITIFSYFTNTLKKTLRKALLREAKSNGKIFRILFAKGRSRIRLPPFPSFCPTMLNLQGSPPPEISRRTEVGLGGVSLNFIGDFPRIVAGGGASRMRP